MKISFSVVGFPDKDKMATFSRDGYTKRGAKGVFSRLLHSGQYERVVMWEDTTEYGVEILKPIKETAR